jgi:hypothetical protein
MGNLLEERHQRTRVLESASCLSSPRADSFERNAADRRRDNYYRALGTLFHNDVFLDRLLGGSRGD